MIFTPDQTQNSKYKRCLLFATREYDFFNTEVACKLNSAHNTSEIQMTSDFGKRLKQSIKNAGLTQTELAAKLGITQQSVNFACSGKAKGSKHAQEMAEILGVDPTWLILGLGETPQPKTNILADEDLPDIYAIRRENTRILLRDSDSQAAFARKLGVTRTHISWIAGRTPTRNISDDLARNMEEKLGLPRAWMDQNRTQLNLIIEEGIAKIKAGDDSNELPMPASTLEPTSAKTVPLYSIEQLNNKEPTSKTSNCPFEGSANTYAFTVEGAPNSATPMQSNYGKSYPVGSIVYVDPDQALSVKNGDAVMALLTDDNVHCFRALYRADGLEILMPLNPQFPPNDRPFEIIGKVIGAVIP